MESACNYVLTLKEDGTFNDKDITYGWSDTGKYTYDGNNSWFFDYNNSNDLYASGNYESLTIAAGQTMSGIQAYVSCSLNK